MLFSGALAYDETETRFQQSEDHIPELLPDVFYPELDLPGAELAVEDILILTNVDNVEEREGQVDRARDRQREDRARVLFSNRRRPREPTPPPVTEVLPVNTPDEAAATSEVTAEQREDRPQEEEQVQRPQADRPQEEEQVQRPQAEQAQGTGEASREDTAEATAEEEYRSVGSLEIDNRDIPEGGAIAFVVVITRPTERENGRTN